MADSLQFKSLDPIVRPSVADQVFDTIYEQVLSVEMPPGTKISEAEIARHLGVSRQPVRDAFFRLSQLGFLVIRPQKATTVSLISARDIFRARFVRTALEVETARRACRDLSQSDLNALQVLLEKQKQAVDAGDRSRFHALDDEFHQLICEQLGFGFCWDVIREKKAHTDRVRFLSLAFASQTALDDHHAIFDAICAKDEMKAEAAVREHLGRIESIIAHLREENHSWFAEED
ncbi:GntR family transcriptional regulator [Algicella marina]|uniref:FCD domain-containing protein n=1 Tax=Algicella marina TaxID=2683284 RepID=A0A6P1SZ32_9RHOB|nr:GntR family transcriptional regulator [Algicella marina]QHQ34785.1 FCD domain-containing protein [Algicella marina]